MNIFERLDSSVCYYSQSWPAVFDSARGSWLYTDSGKPYLDFFAGAGALNYGHNNPILKRTLTSYLERDGITHALDMRTTARADLLDVVEEKILTPRGLIYKVVFPGPAGTNAVEAALKLARKFTGRRRVAYFTNSFHGMSLGSMSVSGNPSVRRSAGVELPDGLELPYGSDSAIIVDGLLSSYGADVAAVIVETVQGEGGLNVVSNEWLKSLSVACREHGILLIIDDVQMGCGRLGTFFSFEEAEIRPDIICLSKSVSGYGFPMAITLIRPELDVWSPGEHNGTFRGFNLAFVTAAETVRTYWSDRHLEKSTKTKGQHLLNGLKRIAANYPEGEISVQGRGLALGLRVTETDVARKIRSTAFEHGLLVEACGPKDEVVKLLPPLTVEIDEIDQALEIIATSVKVAYATRNSHQV